MANSYVLGATDISSYVQELEGVDFGLPEPTVIRSGSPRTYGEDYQDCRWTNRTISIPLLIKGSSVANLDSLTRTILQETYKDTNTLAYTPESGNALTFDIIKSKAHLDPEAALMRRRRFLCKMTLELEAKPFARGTEQINVRGGTVYHYTSGTTPKSYLDILSGDVLGDAPALSRIRLYGLHTSANCYPTIANRTGITATPLIIDLDLGDLFPASGDWYNASAAYVLCDTTNTWYQIASSSPATSLTTAHAGNYKVKMRAVIANGDHAGSATWWRLGYRQDSLHDWQTLADARPWQGWLKGLSGYWYDLGQVDLSSLGNTSSVPSGLQFKVSYKFSGGLGSIVFCDYLHLVPADGDTFYVNDAPPLSGDNWLISSYEGEEPVVITDAVGVKRTASWYGGRIYPEPNVNNRLYFNFANSPSADVQNLSTTISAVVDLTPRYLYVR